MRIIFLVRDPDLELARLEKLEKHLLFNHRSTMFSVQRVRTDLFLSHTF